MTIIPVSKDVTITRGVAFDPFIVLLLHADNTPVDLTGFSAFAQVRKKPHGSIVYTLAPTIMDPATVLYGTTGLGRILVPGYDDEDTLAMTDAQLFWDLVVEDTNNERQGPAAKGKWNIITIITEPSG